MLKKICCFNLNKTNPVNYRRVLYFLHANGKKNKRIILTFFFTFQSVKRNEQCATNWKIPRCEYFLNIVISFKKFLFLWRNLSLSAIITKYFSSLKVEGCFFLFLFLRGTIKYYSLYRINFHEEEDKFVIVKMSNWTIEQVAEWLKKEGFEQFINIFKGNQI